MIFCLKDLLLGQKVNLVLRKAESQILSVVINFNFLYYFVVLVEIILYFTFICNNLFAVLMKRLIPISTVIYNALPNID